MVQAGVSAPARAGDPKASGTASLSLEPIGCGITGGPASLGLD